MTGIKVYLHPDEQTFERLITQFLTMPHDPPTVMVFNWQGIQGSIAIVPMPTPPQSDADHI